MASHSTASTLHVAILGYLKRRSCEKKNKVVLDGHEKSDADWVFRLFPVNTEDALSTDWFEKPRLVLSWSGREHSER